MNTPMPSLGRLVTLAMMVAAVHLAAPAAATAQADEFEIPTFFDRTDDLEEFSGFMEMVIGLYDTDARELRSFYDIGVSPTRLDRMDAFDRQWQRTLERLGGSSEWYDPEANIDHILLRHHVVHALRQRTTLRNRLADAADLLPFAPTIIDLEEARWRIEPVDPREAAATLDALAEQIEALAERVKAVPDEDDDDDDDDASDGGDGDGDSEDASDEPPLSVTAVDARRIARHVGQLSRALSTWHGHHAAYVPGFTWWTEEPFDAAIEQLDAYEEQLRETIAGEEGEDDDPLVGDPIGRDALIDDIAHEMLPYSPEELLALGEEQFAWCEARMLEASRALGFGDDWKAALAEVKSRHVDPGDQDDLVVGQAREAIAWLDDNDLVTIPALCRETWRLRMISKQGQRTLPFAAYGGQVMLVAYPTADMDHPSKEMAMRGNNIHFSRIVTPHELIPGHHLQRFAADRSNTHRSLFGTPFYGEGWALYWELLMWEQEWHRSPEDRIGMLFWRMHRAARIVVSLKFHLGEMEPEAMIDFLVDRVGHERDGATSEVRRYIAGNYSPLYQCGYLVGGLQLWALRGELVDSGEMTDREFHDAVLACNSIPIEMVRASLRAEAFGEDAPSLDHRASWRFIDSLGAFSTFDATDFDDDHHSGGRLDAVPLHQPIEGFRSRIVPLPRPAGAPPGSYYAHAAFGDRGRVHVIRYDGDTVTHTGTEWLGPGHSPAGTATTSIKTLDDTTLVEAIDDLGALKLVTIPGGDLRALIESSRPVIVAIGVSTDSRYAFVACQDATGVDAAIDVIDLAAERRVGSAALTGPLLGVSFARWEQPESR